MKVFNDEQYKDLRDAIRLRWLDWIKIYKALKVKHIFLKNYLLDFSAVGYTNENDKIVPVRANRDPRRWRFSSLMDRIQSLYGVDYVVPVAQGSAELMTRLGENTSAEEVLTNVDINIPDARRLYNVLFTKSVGNKPTFKYRDYNQNAGTQFFSKSLNFYLQRMLQKGKYFDSPDYGLMALEANTIADGTGYLRLDYSIGHNLGRLNDMFEFKFVPVYDIVDDGKYTSDSFYDLEQSEFVMQIYTLPKNKLERFFSKFKQKIDYSQGTDALGVEDINVLWQRFGLDEYRSIRMLEVFWKKYEGKGLDFKWYRTYFLEKGGEIEEIYTEESPYACGLPIIRHKHELTYGNILGYSPVPNAINTDSAKNTTLSQMLTQARRNSYQKIFMSTKAANLKDMEGNYWMPNRDQIFPVPNVAYNGQSITNHIKRLEPAVIDTQAWNIIQGVSNELQRDYQTESVNVNRTSFNAVAEHYRQQNEKYRPMLLSDELFNAKLGEKLYKIFQKEYDGDDRLEIQVNMGGVADGIELAIFDIDDKLPREVADAGIVAEMSESMSAIKNEAFANIQGIITQFGPQVLEDERFVQFYGLRSAGFELPRDRQKMYTLRDIYAIKSGKVTRDEIPQLILKTVFTTDDGATVEEYNIQDHALALETIKDWMNSNLSTFRSLDEETQNNIWYYYEQHFTAMQQVVATTQAMQQSMQPEQQQAQQGEPNQEQLMQMLQNMPTQEQNIQQTS